ncbi:MAG: CBS domain-containing protein [Candidatus Korobacteraceae bacterium]|jgi:CBS domain-containing protein
MSILSICSDEPASVDVNATVAQAIDVMLSHEVGATVVVDEHGVVAGIFTERDVMKRVALSGRDPWQTPVREFMSTPVIMALENISYSEALTTMLDSHLRHMPIVDENGRLLRILSIRNVLEKKIDALLEEIAEAKL